MNRSGSFQEIPYVRIPVNTSRCDGGGHGNHTLNPSLLDPCAVLLYMADAVTRSLSGVTCTSSDCRTISCVESGLNTGRMWSLTILACWGGQYSPSVSVTVTEANGTQVVPSKRLLTSGVVPVDADGSHLLSVKIVNHSSDLSMGLEVSMHACLYRCHSDHCSNHKTLLMATLSPPSHFSLLPADCPPLHNVLPHLSFFLHTLCIIHTFHPPPCASAIDHVFISRCPAFLPRGTEPSYLIRRSP